MSFAESRSRSGYLLLAVMIGHIVLISVQVNRQAGLLDAVPFGVFSEVQRPAAGLVNATRSIWHGYFAFRAARVENEVLKREVETLQMRLQEQQAVVEQARRLQDLLELRVHLPTATTAAQVIAADATPWFRTITIDKGSRDGVRRDMAVLAPKGVVGRVVGEPGPRAAKVQLLIDHNAAAGALVGRSGAGGIVVGSEGDPPLRMEYVSNLADVEVGDTVMTSGIDGIYPKGFVIGTVEWVQRGSGLHKEIAIRPGVDFSGLEGVLVVLSPVAELAAEASP
jgi:rod shape-determining protein MreC